MENIDELPSIDMAILHLQETKQQLTNQLLEEDKSTNLLTSKIDCALPDNNSIKYFAKVFLSTKEKIPVWDCVWKLSYKKLVPIVASINAAKQSQQDFPVTIKIPKRKLAISSV